jgi:hypothetical protein
MLKMDNVLTKSKIGFKFEDEVHKVLETTNKIIMREKEIVSRFGVLCNGVDHLIYNDATHQLILIQDKWRERPQSLSEINHFVVAVKTIEEKTGMFAEGIYLTRRKITKGAMERLNHENNKSLCNKFHCVSDDNMDKSISKLVYKLYSLGIFMYEPDGSAIMLNNEY